MIIIIIAAAVIINITLSWKWKAILDGLTDPLVRCVYFSLTLLSASSEMNFYTSRNSSLNRCTETFFFPQRKAYAASWLHVYFFLVFKKWLFSFTLMNHKDTWWFWKLWLPNALMFMHYNFHCKLSFVSTVSRALLAEAQLRIADGVHRGSFVNPVLDAAVRLRGQRPRVRQPPCSQLACDVHLHGSWTKAGRKRRQKIVDRLIFTSTYIMTSMH